MFFVPIQLQVSMSIFNNTCTSDVSKGKQQKEAR